LPSGSYLRSDSLGLASLRIRPASCRPRPAVRAGRGGRWHRQISCATGTVPYVLTSPGYHVLEIATVGADGTTSDFRIYGFVVSDPTVGVYGYYDRWSPHGGIGVPGPMSFYSGMADQVVEFVYQINGGPEQSVDLPPASTSAWTTITPDRNGPNELKVRSLMTDGRYSPTTTYTFLVGTAPYVSSPQYPNGQWGGGAGIPGDLTFQRGYGRHHLVRLPDRRRHTRRRTRGRDRQRHHPMDASGRLDDSLDGRPRQARRRHNDRPDHLFDLRFLINAPGSPAPCRRWATEVQILRTGKVCGHV
jgi:hypothetical protein